jgi:hypothetical protein
VDEQKILKIGCRMGLRGADFASRNLASQRARPEVEGNFDSRTRRETERFGQELEGERCGRTSQLVFGSTGQCGQVEWISSVFGST